MLISSTHSLIAFGMVLPFVAGCFGETLVGTNAADTGSRSDGGVPLFILQPDPASAGFLHDSEETAHPGGGYYVLRGNGGVEANNTNLTVVEVSDDPLYPGNHRAFRNTYYADGAGQAFANHVIFLRFAERPRFHLRMRVRFSENWSFGNDQLTFSRNGGQSDPHASSITWFNSEGVFLATHNTSAVGQIYTIADWDGDPENPNREGDDINNGFGPGRSDANWTPTLGQWHWLEWELDAVAPGSEEGSLRLWVDGRLYISKSSIQISHDADDVLFGALQLGGHSWEEGLPPQDIYLEFHRVEVFSMRPGPPPGL